MKNLLIINGPNLNLLGKREPVLYGSESFSDVLENIRSIYPNSSITYFQSNDEAELIQALHDASANEIEGIVLNPAAYTHTSIALADAVAAIDIPVIEVHISNVFARENFRKESYISKFAKGVIVGFGTESYRLGIDYLMKS